MKTNDTIGSANQSENCTVTCQQCQCRRKCCHSDLNTACNWVNDLTWSRSCPMRGNRNQGCITTQKAQCHQRQWPSATSLQAQSCQRSNRNGAVDEVKMIWLIRQQDTSLARSADQLSTEAKTQHHTKKKRHPLKQAHHHSVAQDPDQSGHDTRPVTRRNLSDMPSGEKSPTGSHLHDSKDSNLRQYNKDYAHFTNQYQGPENYVFTNQKYIIGGPCSVVIDKEIQEDSFNGQADIQSCDGCDICTGTDTLKVPACIEYAIRKFRSPSSCDPPVDKPLKTSVAEHEYLQFALRITEDIIKNDLYSNVEIKRVFNSHIEANRGRLSLEKMRLQIKDLALELNLSFEDILCSGSVGDDDDIPTASSQDDPNAYSDCCCGSIHCLPYSCGTPNNVAKDFCDCDTSPQTDEKEEKERIDSKSQLEHYKLKSNKYAVIPKISMNMHNKSHLNQEHVPTSPTKQRPGATKKERVSPSRKHPRRRGRHSKRSAKSASPNDDKKQEPEPGDADSSRSDQKDPCASPKARSENDSALTVDDKVSGSYKDSQSVDSKGSSPKPQAKNCGDSKCTLREETGSRKCAAAMDQQKILAKPGDSKEGLGSTSAKTDPPKEVPESDAKGETVKNDGGRKHRRRRKPSLESTGSPDSAQLKKKHHKKKSKKPNVTGGEDRHKQKRKPSSRSDTEEENRRNSLSMSLPDSIDDSLEKGRELKHPKDEDKRQSRTASLPDSVDDSEKSRRGSKLLSGKDASQTVRSERSHSQELPGRKLCKDAQCSSQKFPYHLLSKAPTSKTDGVVQTEQRKSKSLKCPPTTVCCRIATEGTQTCVCQVYNQQKKELPMQADSNFVIVPGPIYIPKQTMKFSPPISPYRPPGLKTIQVAPAVENGADVKAEEPRNPANVPAKKTKDRDSYTQTRANQSSCNRKKCTLKTCFAFNESQARDDLLLSDDYDTGMPESISQFFPTISTQTTSSDFLMIDKIMMAAAQTSKEPPVRRPHRVSRPSSRPRPPSGRPITTDEVKPPTAVSKPKETTRHIERIPVDEPVTIFLGSTDGDDSLTIEEVDTVPILPEIVEVGPEPVQALPPKVVVSGPKQPLPKKQRSKQSSPKEKKSAQKSLGSVKSEDKSEKAKVTVKIDEVPEVNSVRGKVLPPAAEQDLIGPEDVDDEEILEEGGALSVEASEDEGRNPDKEVVGDAEDENAKETEDESIPETDEENAKGTPEVAAEEPEEETTKVEVMEVELIESEIIDDQISDVGSAEPKLITTEDTKSQSQGGSKEFHGDEQVMVGDEDEDDDFMKKLDHKPRMSMTTSMEHRIKKVIHESELFRHPEEKRISWTGEAGIDLSTNLESGLSLTQPSSIMDNTSGLLRNRSSVRDASKTTPAKITKIAEELTTIGEEEDSEED